MFTRPVPLLTFAIGILGANSLILPPIAVAVAADLGSLPTRIVAAMSAYGAGTVISALFLAPKADQIGADRVLRHATALACVALLLTALASTVTWLIAAQGVAGLAAGMALPAIYGLAAQVAPKGQEKQVIGTVLTGWTLSLVGGVVLATAMTDLWGWRSLYALMAAVTALIWVLLTRCDMGVTPSEGAATSPLTALRVPGITRALFANLMLMFGFFGAYGFLGTHVVEVLGRSTTQAGVLTMIYGSGYGIAALLNRFVDRLSRQHAMALGFAGLGVAHLATGIAAPSYVALMGTVFLWGIFQAFGLNAVVDRLNRLEPRQRGAIMGLNSASTYLCVTIGATAYALPYASFGLAGCVAISALCSWLAAAESLTPNRQR
ncbi:MFS transporter [Thalassobius sp. MITS945101]|uniref:MFS transporter n=1 Tax=Thalassobius sp. MITS945101 TaxID=3096994 RepID=UPI00399B70F9